MVDITKLAGKLKRLVKSSNYSQADIARELGVTEQAVSKWVRTGQVSDANLQKLLELLDVDFWHFKKTGAFQHPDAVAPPVKDGERDVPFLIYNRAKKLNPTMQLAVLQLLDTIIASMHDARQKLSRKKRREPKEQVG